MCYCIQCQNNPCCQGSHDILFRGQALASDMVGACEEAERLEIDEVTTFYHYFYDSSGTARKIQESGVVASRAKCMCTECIKRSLTTSQPHYGDGAYGTANGSFQPHDEEPVSVLRAHGFTDLKNRTLRAVLRLKNPDAFRKFPNTGGILRSHPSPTEQLMRDNLCYHSIEDAYVLRIETWSDEDGEWIPLGKGDLDGI